MDNMRVHRSRAALAKFQSLNVIPIFNIPYSPQFNGIESVFSMVKAAFKKSLLKEIIAGERRNSIKLIKRAIIGLDSEKVKRCVVNGIY